MRYKIKIEYYGTNLVGWQENPHGDSVQSLIQNAIFKFCGERVIVYSAGRTDAGVHARGMIGHFDLEREFEPNTVMRAINFYLKDSPVIILDCEITDDEFHSRFSCKQRTYEYIILNRPSRPVLDKNRVWHIAQKLDVNAMRVAAEKFVGNHDWTSFRASECQAKSPIKTLDSIEIRDLSPIALAKGGQRPEIRIIVSARSFLHHQVRNIVGTLVEIGRGKNMDIDEIFAAKNRSAAGPTAPASGLYFISAIY